jgi:hypothetical protein
MVGGEGVPPVPEDSQPGRLRALALGQPKRGCGRQFHAVPSFVLGAVESLVGCLDHLLGAGGPLKRGSITRVCLLTLIGNNWGCATSRAFREVACRTADTVPLHFTRPEAGPSLKHIPLVDSHQNRLVRVAGVVKDAIRTAVTLGRKAPTFRWRCSA